VTFPSYMAQEKTTREERKMKLQELYPKLEKPIYWMKRTEEIAKGYRGGPIDVRVWQAARWDFLVQAIHVIGIEASEARDEHAETVIALAEIAQGLLQELDQQEARIKNLEDRMNQLLPVRVGTA